MLAGATDGIKTWIVDTGLDGAPLSELMAGFCGRLVEAGVPLWRASIGAESLHPLNDAQGYVWHDGEGAQESFFPRKTTSEQEQDWLASPFYQLIEGGEQTMRRRLAVGEGANEFPMLGRLAAEGGTDYFARLVDFGEQGRLGELRGLATSWTTRDSAGFAEDDVGLIEATLPTLGLAFKARLAADTARTVATTYLGSSVAGHVLKGEIERGKVRAKRMVLWFSDLTGFTRLADTLPQDQLIELLNAYADCLVEVVHAYRGQVVKFLGDGILGGFYGERGEACGRALDAALAACAAIEALNEVRAAAGLPVTGFTLALHEGDVLYGNIGSRDRLDYTVVGPAVNEIARIQSMSRPLDEPVLVSASFVEACSAERARLVSLGRYALKGVNRPQELFTLDREEVAVPALG